MADVSMTVYKIQLNVTDSDRTCITKEQEECIHSSFSSRKMPFALCRRKNIWLRKEKVTRRKLILYLKGRFLTSIDVIMKEPSVQQKNALNMADKAVQRISEDDTSSWVDIEGGGFAENEQQHTTNCVHAPTALRRQNWSNVLKDNATTNHPRHLPGQTDLISGVQVSFHS